MRVKKHIRSSSIEMLRGIYIYIYILFWLFNDYFTCFNESAKNNFILAFLKKKNTSPTYLAKMLNHYLLQ